MNNNLGLRVGAVVLAVILALSAVFAQRTRVHADEFSGKCGDDAYWELSDDGTLRIYGSGNINPYYGISGGDIYDYDEDYPVITVDYSMTSDNLTTVAAGVTTAKSATAATTVKSSASATSSSSEVAADTTATRAITTETTASAITGVTINADYNRTWKSCDSDLIKKVVIEDGITEIGYGSFEYCENLTEVSIPDSVTGIDNFAFEGCTSLQSVTFGDNSKLEFIGEWAFFNCKNLDEVKIPVSVVSIGFKAFGNCTSLKRISIPKNVKKIEESFYGCSSLEYISVNKANTVYDSRNGSNAIMETATNTLVLGCRNTTVPNSVTTIGEYAFCGCTGLTELTFGSNSELKVIGQNAFEDCTSLKKVTIPDSLTTIDRYAFYDCSSLKSISAGKNSKFTTLGRSALEGTPLYENESSWKSDSLYIGKCLVKVRESAEGNFTIKAGTKVIAEKAFYDCSSLQNVEIPSSVTDIVYGTFSSCTSLEKVAIPDSIKSIGEYAFSECTSLENIKISKNVTTIGDSAFLNCSNFTEVNIPAKVSSIGCDILSGCENVESISVDESNVTYDSRNNCNAIIETETNTLIAGCKNTVIPSDVTEIRYGAFTGCTGLAKITIPGGVEYIPYNEFKGCTGLEKLVISDGVKEIYGWAFDSCSNLTKVTISDSVKEIGFGAFYGCYSITDVYYPGSESDRDKIKISAKNDCLLDATWHYLSEDSDNDDKTPTAEETTKSDNTTEETTKPEATTKTVNTTVPVLPVTTVNAVINTASGASVEYASNVTIKATATGVPENYYLALYVNGNLVRKGTSTEVSYNFSRVTSDISYTVKVVDKNGNVLNDSEGNEVAKDGGKITTSAGFFAKIIAFFKGLFGLLPKISFEP